MRISVVPSFWFVGFSGHRHIKDPEKILSSLAQELGKLHRQAPSHLVGVSSLAIGGDQLFLRACQAEGIPYEVLFPFPMEEFKKDFDAPDWDAAQGLLKTALTYREGEMKKTRPEGYLACGFETVDECDVLMVVWNGLEAAGVGGTKDIVDYARRLGKPLVWIHSETYEVKTENLGEKPFDDKSTDTLRKLLDPPDHGNALPEIQPCDAVERLMKKADDYATRSAPAVRKLGAGLVLLNLAVVGFGCAGAIAELWPSPFSKQAQTVLNALRFVLFVIVFGMAASNAAKVRQGYWLASRFAAEVCRSILATWGLPIRPGLILAGTPSEFAHLIRSICFLHSLDRKRSEAARAENVNRYAEDRIEGQIDYYRKKSEGLAPRQKFLRFLVIGGMVASGILMAVLLLDALCKPWIPDEKIVRGLSNQLLQFAPLLATSALSLIYVYEIQRRLVHNKRMIVLLTRCKTQIATAPTERALESHITRCEQALLSEVQDWYYYSLYGK